MPACLHARLAEELQNTPQLHAAHECVLCNTRKQAALSARGSRCTAALALAALALARSMQACVRKRTFSATPLPTSTSRTAGQPVMRSGAAHVLALALALMMAGEAYGGGRMRRRARGAKTHKDARMQNTPQCALRSETAPGAVGLASVVQSQPRVLRSRQTRQQVRPSCLRSRTKLHLVDAGAPSSTTAQEPSQACTTVVCN